MSHFFGFLKKKTITYQHKKQQLEDSLSFFSADAKVLFENEHIYLSNHFLFNTPESTLQTSICKIEDLYLVGSVRLDNRESLFKKLNISTTQTNLITDYQLILKSYQNWKEDCVKHLVGAFSFVIWNAKTKSLFLAKDQIGIRPLFYCDHPYGFIFATSITTIKAFFDNNYKLKHNLKYISTMLRSVTPEVNETSFQNIHRLRPAHTVQYKKGNLSHEKRYWNLQPTDISYLKTDKERYTKLRELFEEAILCRARTVKNIGCQLSGGLDSSSIAVVLARKTNKDKLHTFSFTHNDKTRDFSTYKVDEQETQNAILKQEQISTKNHHKIQNFHFKDVFEELDATHRIMGGVTHSNSVWQSTLFKEQSKHNVGVSFSGFPGDEGISNGGGWFYHEYIYKRQYAKLFKTFGLKSIIKLASYYKQKTKKYITFKNQQKKDVLAKNTPFYNKIPKKHLNNISSFTKYISNRVTRTHTTLRTESEGLYAREFGIETVYPLADIRLLQYIVSLPVEMFQPKKHNRILYRTLCKGILPDKVRLQPKFSGATTLAFAGYIKHCKNISFKEYALKNHYRLIDEGKFYSLKEDDLRFRINTYELDYLVEKDSSII